jgi:hypothetical protein
MNSIVKLEELSLNITFGGLWTIIHLRGWPTPNISNCIVTKVFNVHLFNAGLWPGWWTISTGEPKTKNATPERDNLQRRNGIKIGKAGDKNDDEQTKSKSSLCS